MHGAGDYDRNECACADDDPFNGKVLQNKSTQILFVDNQILVRPESGDIVFCIGHRYYHILLLRWKEQRKGCDPDDYQIHKT